MMVKEQLVAVLPDGTEHFEELRYFTDRHRSIDSDFRLICENAVRKAGLTTPRHDPVPVQVGLFDLEIQAGKLGRRKIRAFDIMPPLERMTDAQYSDEMQEILSEVPVEFRSYVASESYDRGHSAGYEECTNIAQSIVAALKPCIEAFRITTERVAEIQ